MNTIIKNIEDAQLKAQAPEFRVGDTVRVSAKIKEGNRERIQVFEGTVLKKQGTGVRERKTYDLHAGRLYPRVPKNQGNGLDPDTSRRADRRWQDTGRPAGH